MICPKCALPMQHASVSVGDDGVVYETVWKCDQPCDTIVGERHAHATQPVPPAPTLPLSEADHLAKLAEYFTEFADGPCHVHGLALVQMVVASRAREAVLETTLQKITRMYSPKRDLLDARWAARAALAATAAPPTPESTEGGQV